MLKAALFVMLPAIAAAAPCEKPDAELWNVKASDAGLTACFDDGKQCWAFDGAKWTEAAAKALPAPGEGETNRGLGGIAETSADGKRAFVRDENDSKKLALVDAGTKKPIAQIPIWKTPMMDNGFSIFGFVDDTAIVWLSSSPVSSQARLYGPKGKILAKLGTDDLGENLALALGNHQWLFPNFDGNEAYVYEVTTGKRLATISLASRRVVKAGGRNNDAIIQLVGGKVWAMQGPADSGAAVYDVATKKSTRVPLPLCK